MLCREKVGACIQCEKNTCFTAFHVTCARQMGWLQSLKSYRIEDGQLKGWCDKHLPVRVLSFSIVIVHTNIGAMADPQDEYRKVDVLAPSDDESSYDPHDGHSPHPHARKSGVVIKKARGGNAHLHKKGASAIAALPSAVVTTKTARAHAKSYRPGPPIVPNVIVQSVTDYVAKINIRKRTGLVERVCRYWSLKREARRGAPLLKRLHLEVSAPVQMLELACLDWESRLQCLAKTARMQLTYSRGPPIPTQSNRPTQRSSSSCNSLPCSAPISKRCACWRNRCASGKRKSWRRRR